MLNFTFKRSKQASSEQAGRPYYNGRHCLYLRICLRNLSIEFNLAADCALGCDLAQIAIQLRIHFLVKLFIWSSQHVILLWNQIKRRCNLFLGLRFPSVEFRRSKTLDHFCACIPCFTIHTAYFIKVTHPMTYCSIGGYIIPIITE